MNDGLSGLSKEELLDYAKMLMSGAADRIDAGMPQDAVWRLMNAVGAIAACLDDGPTPGIDTFTTLGYRLETRDDDTKQTP